MTVIKAGFGFSGRGGKGVVVARLRNGWSAPSAIGTGGAGFGLNKAPYERTRRGDIGGPVHVPI